MLSLSNSKYRQINFVNESMILLDARLLQAFIAVAEERHFGRAAQRLHLSQPPVSQRIRQLEDALGVQLFVRSTRQVALTPAGAELYRRALQLTNDAASAEAAVRRVASGEHGELRIGFTRTAAARLLPRLLANYHDHRPGVKLHLHEDWSAQLIDLLLHEKLDIALLRRSTAATHPKIRFTLIEREPLWLVMPKGHRLGRKRKVHPSQLHGEALVGYSPSTAQYFHETLNTMLSRYGVEPNIRHQSAIPTILTLVGAGMGVALVPRPAVRLRPPETVAVPLEDPEQVANVELYCATREDDVNPAVAAAITILQHLQSDASDSAITGSQP